VSGRNRGARSRAAPPLARWIGALGGAVGILPLLPIASGLAIRYAAPPDLPGALRKFHDVKEATWAEAAVLLVAVPLAALLFGRILPAALERVAPPGRLSFAWAGAAFSASFFLAQRGVRPKLALLAGVVLAALAAAAITAFRRSFALRRLFARRNRPAILALALVGASLAFARRAGFGAKPAAADLATELSIAAILLPAIALAACLLLFRHPGRALRRLGAAAPLAVGLSAAIVLFGGRAGWSSALALALLPAAAAWRPAERVSRPGLCAALLLLVFACGWRLSRAPFLPVEPFEDGCSLAFAQAYLHGARPYAETYPLHGWGSDGGVDGFAFRHFGATLRVYRLRTAFFAALAPLAMAGSCVAALGAGIWGVFAFLVSASFSPRLIERQALAFAALIPLFLSFRPGSRRRALRAAAGAITGLEILYSLEYGLIVFLGISAALVLLPILEARLRRLRLGLAACAHFWAGVLAGAFPFLVLLAARGVLGDFMRISFVELPRWVTPVWGLPAGDVWKALSPVRDVPAFAALLAGAGMQFFFVMALLAIAGTTLLLRSASGELDSEDRAAWVAFGVAAFALRGVLGRADESHLWNYSVFAGIPAVWLLRFIWRSEARAVLFPVALLFLLVRLHPLRGVEDTLRLVASTGDPAAHADRAEPPRSGGERLPAGQAKELSDFRRAIDERLGPGQTFFDFANQPALYFFADRVPPVRFHTVAQYESEEKQREVLEALERTKPPVAVFTDTFYSSLDVSNAERAPSVARYLAEHYLPDATVGSWRLERRRRAAGD
jgi:hypothetical protein